MLSFTKCDARVRGNTSYTIGERTFYQGIQCGQEATKKICVDNGEAFVTVCNRCLRDFLCKKDWLGFFDGSIPPEADVIESKLYFDTVLEVYKEENPKVISVTPKDLRKWIEDILQKGDIEEKKEALMSEKKSLNKWISEYRQENFSEFVKAVKRKIEIDSELQLLE